MVVKEDGKPDATIPISAGASSPASQNTFNGTMVVMAKEGTTVMDSSTVVNHEGPAYKVEMPHALRLTPTGTYVHGKYAPGVFGRTNTSHGCIGLEDTSAKDGSPGSSARPVLRRRDRRRPGHRAELGRPAGPAGQRPERLEHQLGQVVTR
ncbi:L,D-transpeptidase [Kitasatospora arboriphila]